MPEEGPPGLKRCNSLMMFCALKDCSDYSLANTLLMCEPLMPDVVAPEMHQNNRSYVRSADLPSDSLRENFSMVGCYTENPEKPQNLGGGRLHGYGRLLETIQY